MKKGLLLLVLSACFLGLAVGCAGETQNTAIVQLEGNATTGYSWDYTIVPDGIVNEVSHDYVQSDAAQGTAGAGGTYIFTFEGAAPGQAEITFNYARQWEDVPALDVAVYKAVVDSNRNIKLELIQAPAGF